MIALYFVMFTTSKYLDSKLLDLINLLIHKFYDSLNLYDLDKND